ncbi:MAG: hypothetical protein E7560_01560 [Ruminococcaceae bacterium]|nr:hypothetical protein [Oscillospiraceae bacterium]
MHVVILTDLEGVSCVDSIDMIPYANEGYKKACEYLMYDTNAAVDGAFLGGATKVTVIDGHGGANNFIMELLDKRATYLPCREFCREPIEKFGFDALMCVGAHAMAGTVNAFLDHTESSIEWFEYLINGVPGGEMVAEAHTLAAVGAPFIMASGDEAVCKEAKELVPNISVAVVKKAIGRNKAECLPLEKATELIRKAAKEAVENCSDIKPIELKLPAEITVTFTRNDYCDEHLGEGLVRNGRTLTKKINKVVRYTDLLI